MNNNLYNNQQLFFIYNSQRALDKRAQATLTASKKKVLYIDLHQQKISQTLWAQIADSFGGNLQDLMDLKALDLPAPADFSQHDLMKILERNPNTLRFPLLFSQQKSMQIKQESDVLQFFDVDSGGFIKTFHTDKVNIDKTTDNQRFTPPLR